MEKTREGICLHSAEDAPLNCTYVSLYPCLFSTTLDSSLESRSLAVSEVVLKVVPSPKKLISNYCCGGSFLALGKHICPKYYQGSLSELFLKRNVVL